MKRETLECDWAKGIKTGESRLWKERTAGGREDKKIGAESSDPNRHSQPRLPGSVVGEASMRLARKSRKITEVTVQKLRVQKLPLRVCDQYSAVAQNATTGAEARVDSGGLRGAEAPLFHGATRIRPRCHKHSRFFPAASKGRALPEPIQEMAPESPLEAGRDELPGGNFLTWSLPANA
jgi:hypothetical protein